MTDEPDWDAVRIKFRNDLAAILKRPVETLPLIVDDEWHGLPPGDRRRRRWMTFVRAA